jgi:hypothetical protein
MLPFGWWGHTCMMSVIRWEQPAASIVNVDLGDEIKTRPPLREPVACKCTCQPYRATMWVPRALWASYLAWSRSLFPSPSPSTSLDLPIRTKLLGKEHKDTLSSMVMVGLATSLAGRWTEAEELEVQVMETSWRVLGSEHPDYPLVRRVVPYFCDWLKSGG